MNVALRQDFFHFAAAGAFDEEPGIFDVGHFEPSRGFFAVGEAFVFMVDLEEVAASMNE